MATPNNTVATPNNITAIPNNTVATPNNVVPPNEPADSLQLTASIRKAYDFILNTLLIVIKTVIQPYVYCFNFGKRQVKRIYNTFACFIATCIDVITIFTLTIRASILYLTVWNRLLNGLNNEKATRALVLMVQDILKLIQNICKRYSNEPERSSTRRSESSVKSATFPPIIEVEEPSDHDSGNESESGSNSRQKSGANDRPGEADQREPTKKPVKNGGSGGGSGGGVNGGINGNGVNGFSKAKDPKVTFAEHSSRDSSTGSLHTGSNQPGVDEVDKSDKEKTSPKQSKAATITSPV